MEAKQKGKEHAMESVLEPQSEHFQRAQGIFLEFGFEDRGGIAYLLRKTVLGSPGERALREQETFRW